MILQRQRGLCGGQEGNQLEESDGGVHGRQKVTVARGDARGSPEGLDVLYQQSPAIYHLCVCVCVCVCV